MHLPLCPKYLVFIFKVHLQSSSQESGCTGGLHVTKSDHFIVPSIAIGFYVSCILPSYINSVVHLSNKSCHRGSPISGSRNCSSDTKLSKLCPVDVLTLFVLRKALLSACIGSFSYGAACSSLGIDGYQTLIDQTRPAFTTPVESVSRKEVPGQAVSAQQAS